MAVRPCDVTDSCDGRLLAVAFESMTVSCETTGRALAHFDLAGGFPPGFHPIFGLSTPEPWGVWNDGRRSCFLLCLDQGLASSFGYRLSIEHHIFEGESSIRARVRANGQHMGELSFVTEGKAEIVIPAEHMPAAIGATSANISLGSAAEPELSVIIINYNRWELTTACIISILSSNVKQPYDIIIVDNGSNVAKFAELASAELPVEIRRLDERRSFGEANNFAAERARGSRLLLLNNDAFVQPDCINQLYDALDILDVGAAGPVFEEPDGRLQEAGTSLGADGNVTIRDYSHLATPRDLPAVCNVDHISAACLMVRKDDFIRLGGFDLAYEPAYHEDVDLCCRLHATGQNVVLVRGARAVHIRNATRETLASSDPVLSAPARNLKVFRSRWGKWLWTRDAWDLPPAETLQLSNWEGQLAAFRDEPVNAVFSTEPLADAHTALAISSALSTVHPTLFSTETPYSMLRLLRLGRDFSLPLDQVATASMGSLGERHIEIFVQSTCLIPPETASYGKRRFLHCPMLIRAERLTDEERRVRVEALSNFEAIITNSEISQRKLLARLNYIGAPHLPIVVMQPPVAAASLTDPGTKQDLIVSIGQFRGGPGGGTHGPILRGFQNFQRNANARGWELVCMGEVYNQDDLSYFNQLALRAATWGVRCLAMPSERQRRELYRRAKVCISAAGFDLRNNDENRMRPYSGVAIGNAIVQGCLPVVPAGGIEAELCESLGMRFTFHLAEEIEEQISLAVSLARCEDAVADLRRRAASLSVEAFVKNWQQILGQQHASSPPIPARTASR
ncbi:MAG: hypothetical protein QOH65_1162 [Methylobacteriaceae bacterium]|nr:hypothetical protein [Methylobacteriaceae bacterium]